MADAFFMCQLLEGSDDGETWHCAGSPHGRYDADDCCHRPPPTHRFKMYRRRLVQGGDAWRGDEIHRSDRVIFHG